MEKKSMTAVKWLVEQMIDKLGIRIENTTEGCELFEQAKAMEKEQIIDAYATAIMKENNSDYIGMNEEINGEQYYNETFEA
jgi:hypothetical protein